MKQRPQTHDWEQIDQQAFAGLATDTEHVIQVRREAIPLIFVPGIMGSRLRRTGTNPDGESEGLPNLRWDVHTHGAAGLWWMIRKFMYRGAAYRKRLLIGAAFSSDYLEVDNDDPVGDGLRGIITDYRPFLNDLRERDWGALSRLFVFPVYAHGYNWTASNEQSALKLVERIDQVIAEAAAVTGRCDKVILITHSMGGLVARAASELLGGSGRILGIVHGVQPATGASAAYWRMKAGFEGNFAASAILGNEGPDVTAVLANAPGGLQLLPNKHHRTAAGEPDWLRIVREGKVEQSWPRNGNPYAEIYAVAAQPLPEPGEGASHNTYWGLVDPALLDPDNAHPPDAPAGAQMPVPPMPPDMSAAMGAAAAQALAQMAAAKSGADPNATDATAIDPNATDRKHAPVSPWRQYKRLLRIAEQFHDRLGVAKHAHTFNFAGVGHATADVIELHLEDYWVQRDPYQTRGFFGYCRDAQGEKLRAVLQDPAGTGDATVPVYSARVLNQAGKPPPGDTDLTLEHQPAYEAGAAQTYTLNAIKALCEKHFNDRHG